MSADLHARARHRAGRPGRGGAGHARVGADGVAASARGTPMPTAGLRTSAPSTRRPLPAELRHRRYFPGEDAFFPRSIVNFTVGEDDEPLPRAAAAQPVRIQHLPRELRWASSSGANNYGKSRGAARQGDARGEAPRAARPDRRRGAERATSRPSTSRATTPACWRRTRCATPSTRSRRAHPVDQIESFGIALVERFLAAGPSVTRARVRIASTRGRASVAHPHAFQRGHGGTRVATVSSDGSELSVQAGIDDLLVLKTTGSGCRASTAMGSRRCRRPTTGSWPPS